MSSDLLKIYSTEVLIISIKILALVIPLLIIISFAVWADRRIWAAVQLRRGPNVVGPLGLFQIIADALKYFLKEIIIPAASNKGVFIIAPLITFVLALIGWAVIPLQENLVISNINVGICLLYTSPSPRDGLLSRMPSSA